MIKFGDTETCGKTGPIVLIQYAVDDGPITLYEVWNEPIKKTLDLIEWFMSLDNVYFNIGFDYFHYVRLYNVLRFLYDTGYRDIPSVNTIAKIDEHNPVEWCLKPPSCLDIMLYCRRGEYQSTMARSAIYVRKVPRLIAPLVKRELESRIEIDPIYFAKSKKGYQWAIEELKDEEPDEDFVNITLKFASSGTLSDICAHCLGEPKKDDAIPRDIMPTEAAWKPYGSYGEKPWPSVIHKHMYYWYKSDRARNYAWRDIDLLRKLYHHFKKNDPDNFVFNDTDSQLAIAVANTRWRGFTFSHEGVAKLQEKYTPVSKSAPTYHGVALPYLHEVMTDEQKLIVTSTDRKTLESISQWEDSEAATRAEQIIAARSAEKYLDILGKMSQLNTLHPDFKIIGTRSNRMSGGSEDSEGASINPQGIPRIKEFRELFTLCHPGETLWGGDADAYEPTIMDSVFGDPKLHEDLKSGKKFHTLFAQRILKMPYAEIMADDNLYHKAKQVSLGWAYGAQPTKGSEILDIPVEQVEEGFYEIERDYPGIGRRRDEIRSKFCSMQQPDGIGSAVIWNDPDDYVESIFGFRRYFTLENAICKQLFLLANKPPSEFRKVSGRVSRRRRYQTIGGAAQSAIYAAAFNIQARNLRQAFNHLIQSSGATITKGCQLRFWNLQPVGISRFRVTLFQVHDELWNTCDGSFNPTDVMGESVEYYRKWVPLLKWPYGQANNWSEK
jgi:DNA polymerase I-like protein with 3'-5' exonuclease and polymerase domains